MKTKISPELLAHKSSPSATLCFLLLIGPFPDDSYIGLSSLDRDVAYNPSSTDGSAPDVDQVFYARTGIDVSNIASGTDESSDKSEGRTLVPVYPGQGVTEAMVDNGDLDDIEYVLYQVNYNDLSMGHEYMEAGRLAEVTCNKGGLVTFEHRTWADLMRQNSVIQLDSLTCRATFGSQPGDELYPCMKDISGMWVTAGCTVTSVGAETVRDFTASGLAGADGLYRPGLCEWLSGANAGARHEVASFASGGVISLLFAARHPVQVDDMFRIRRGCTLFWSGNNGCGDHGNREWFRGEPFIPVSDTIALSTPGVAGNG